MLSSTILSSETCQTCSLCDISVGLNQALLHETMRASATVTPPITPRTQVTRPTMVQQALLHLSIAPSAAMLRTTSTTAVNGSRSSHTTTMINLATTTTTTRSASTDDFDRRRGEKEQPDNAALVGSKRARSKTRQLRSDIRFNH